MTSVRGRDRQLNTKRSKAANAGFSLVELLIAVTILAIIVIPLLHMFVTSTRINVKSRQTLRATTVAQDIMEGLKAYNLEEVRTQFSLPDGSISSDYFYPTEGFYIVNSSMIQGGVREIKELETARDDDGNFDNPDNPNNEIYYFGIENLKMQGGEYDALIKLDASTYTKTKVDDGSGHDNAFNGKYYADTKSVSETNGGSDKDSSYHEHSEMNKNVLEDIKEQIRNDLATAGDTTHDSDLESLKLEDLIEKRNITVVIEAAGSDECKATITFEYICRDPYGYHVNPDPKPERNNKYVSYGKALSTSGVVGGEGNEPTTRTFSSGNFYLFYYPIYKTGVDNILFDIRDSAVLFDEEQPLLKSITLAKQIRSYVDVTNNVIAPDMTDAELFAAESSYVAVTDISIDSTMGSNLLFRTNFDTNMSQQAKNMNPPPNMSTTFGGGFTNTQIKQTDMTGDNVSDKVTNVIYDIEITVYKTGAAQHFKEGPGFESSDDVQRLAVITNLD